MKRKKIIPLIALFLLLLLQTKAQNLPSFYPFKGFNVGVTGQAQFIQKNSFLPLIGSLPAPIPIWTYGWEMGIEFSYHFAKYFGISVGINFGTGNSYGRYIDRTHIYDDPRMNDPFKMIDSENDFIFPVKLEFHYPLRKNLFFTAEAGVRIKGVLGRLAYGKDFILEGSIGAYMEDYHVPGTNIYYIKPYYYEYGWTNFSKIHCNLLLGIGLYYQLPYGDLLKFTAGINMSFKNEYEGYYKYFVIESYGTYSVKNDFIYTQLSYIHTLNWQKAKKYLKKQEYWFSSKKERNEMIIEMLNIW